MRYAVVVPQDLVNNTEVGTWCDENLVGRYQMKWRHTKRDKSGAHLAVSAKGRLVWLIEPTYRFSHKRDAILFKLRWL